MAYEGGDEASFAVNVVVGMRALNEELLLPVALANYDFATFIVITDGGSTDRTKEIALADERVIWHDFKERVPGVNGGWRNPEGKHMQFLIEKCEELEPDWLWITEVDAFPNLNLQRTATAILSQLDYDGIKLLQTYLMYIAPDGQSHYPRTMQGPGYTAWKPGLATVDASADFDGQGRLFIAEQGKFDTHKIASRIHLTWETEEAIAAKDKFYQQVHGWCFNHPDATWGPREALPEWAIWNDPRELGGLAGYGVERTWARSSN